MKKHLCAALALLLLAAGCAKNAQPPQASAEPEAVQETPAAAEELPAAEDGTDYTTGTPWLCSYLDGNVTEATETPDLKNDFYLACNKEKLQNSNS